MNIQGGMDEYTPEVEICADDLSDYKTFEEAENYILRRLRDDIRQNAGSCGYFDGSEYRVKIQAMLDENQAEREAEED